MHRASAAACRKFAAFFGVSMAAALVSGCVAPLPGWADVRGRPTSVECGEACECESAVAGACQCKGGWIERILLVPMDACGSIANCCAPAGCVGPVEPPPPPKFFPVPTEPMLPY